MVSADFDAEDAAGVAQRVRIHEGRERRTQRQGRGQRQHLRRFQEEAGRTTLATNASLAAANTAP